jgi:hypothetical protein
MVVSLMRVFSPMIQKQATQAPIPKQSRNLHRLRQARRCLALPCLWYCAMLLHAIFECQPSTKQHCSSSIPDCHEDALEYPVKV